MKTIVIIGGGFSGTMTAVNLARASESPLRIVIVNHRYPLGRGVAYSTRRAEHLLNVAARNMSALADHPNHFVEWLRTRNEYADTPESVIRETFIPRRVYGDYLRNLFVTYARPVDSRRGVEIETVDGEAVDIVEEGQGARVVLASGLALEADKVLLATGNQPPAELPSTQTPLRHPGYCETPWIDLQSRLPALNDTALLLGTGLTTVDAFLTLEALGWQGPIIAISRNGLMPLSHFRGIEYAEFPPGDPTTLRLAALAELLEEHCGKLRSMGANPAIVVDKMRPFTQRVWQNFTVDEKREFCARYQARWNVTRHRIAQQIHERVAAAQLRGQLQVVKGKIRSVDPDGNCVRVTLEDVPGSTKTMYGALVVNCTGPQTSFSASQVPLFQNLLARGHVRPDDIDMGVNITSDFAAVTRDGERSRFLFAMGPLVKGTLWETIAVPELRGQALRMAQTLLDACAVSERKPDVQAVDEAVMEYFI